MRKTAVADPILAVDPRILYLMYESDESGTLMYSRDQSMLHLKRKIYYYYLFKD